MPDNLIIIWIPIVILVRFGDQVLQVTMSANIVISSQELVANDDRSDMESVHSSNDNNTVSCKERLVTEHVKGTELTDLSCSTVINDSHVPDMASTDTDQQISEKKEVSLVTPQDTTIGIMTKMQTDKQNDVQSIPESSDNHKNARCDTELANSNDEICQKMDNVCDGVQMDYRGVDSNSAKSDTSSLSSEDESSSELR